MIFAGNSALISQFKLSICFNYEDNKEQNSIEERTEKNARSQAPSRMNTSVKEVDPRTEAQKWVGCQKHKCLVD